MGKTAKILLQINASRTYGRSLLKGIIKYAKLHTNWTIFSELPYYLQKRSNTKIFENIKKWNPDGIILREAENIEKLLSLKVPTIVSPNVIVDPGIKAQLLQYPGIITDCRAIGRMGADYFLNKGYKSLAFVGYEADWSHLRQDAFSQWVESRGGRVFTMATKSINSSNRGTKVERFATWLKELPKPLAVMACNDDRALDVIYTCKLAGLHVPEEIAVLGVDNDDVICEMCNPSLSSIVINAEKAGYDAAELLDQMIHHQTMWSHQNILVHPHYVLTRQSSDMTAIENTVVAQALNFIRSNIHKPLRVSDVAEFACVSRRSLELWFKKTLGKNIYAEIKRLRVEAISRNLLETNLPIHKIAENFGFSESVNLSRFFKNATNISLRDYRKVTVHGGKPFF